MLFEIDFWLGHERYDVMFVTSAYIQIKHGRNAWTPTIATLGSSFSQTSFV